MPKMMISQEYIEREIETAFPFIEMPSATELTFHGETCAECEDLKRDLEEYRGKKITSALLRLIHQELSLLSSKAWCWILPYYLRFGVSKEAIESEMEVQFLIYNLGPAEQFQADTSTRLSLLNRVQIICLIHFLEWCSTQAPWKDSYWDSLNRGIIFLTGLKENLDSE